jgi:hypothetical protein
MKAKIFFSFFTLCYVSGILYSQTSDSSLTTVERRDSVRLYYHSLLDNARDNLANITSAGNGNRNSLPVTVGREISGSFYYKDYPWMESYGVSLAFYPGYSNSINKRGHGFNGQSFIYHNYTDKPQDYYNNDTFVSYTPGLSLYSKNRKVSIDLYRIPATQTFVNGKQQIVPYKVSLHF